MNAPARTGIIVVVSIGLVVLAATTIYMLKGKGSQGTAQTPPPAPEVERTPYTTTGAIVSLPEERGAPDHRGEMQIAHEEIPEFKDASGKVVGMGAMTMSFKPAEGVDLTGLNVGDSVTFTFEVWWQPKTDWELTAIRKNAP